MDQTFKIITPVYNAEQWIGKCISSVREQTHSNFIQIIVDDCSTDDTLKVAKKAIDGDDRFIIIERQKKTGTMRGHILACDYAFSSKEIIVHLDGDDWFSSDQVLERLNKVYEDEDIWCTYGNYKTTDETPSVCKSIEDPYKPFRHYLLTGWIFSQVRSFRAFLWKGLEEEDFRSEDGSYLAVADVAIFLPVLEMAGINRLRYIPEVQMIYNRETPINDDKINRNLVIDHAFQLASREIKQVWKS